MFATILAWFAKPFVPYLIGAIITGGIFYWFQANYVPKDTYQLLAGDLQRTQEERNLAELKIKRQAEEFADKLQANRQLWQEKESQNKELQRHMDAWSKRFAEIGNDPTVQEARDTTVPPPIVFRLREFPTRASGDTLD